MRLVGIRIGRRHIGFNASHLDTPSRIHRQFRCQRALERSFNKLGGELYLSKVANAYLKLITTVFDT
jgi:hypothetical protein